MESAIATPPLYSSCSKVPASWFHWVWVTGSLATGAPAAMACSMLVRLCCIVPDPASLALYLARLSGLRM